MPIVFALLGSLCILTDASALLTTAVYVLLVASGLLSHFWAHRRLMHAYDERIEYHRSEADKHRLTYEQSKTAAPTGVLEAVLAHPHSPPDLRADIQAELVRRGKGVLN